MGSGLVGTRLSKLGQWDSRKCALALFSVNQDVILEELQDRFDIQSRASWPVVRDLCLPLWLKDGYKPFIKIEAVQEACTTGNAPHVALDDYRPIQEVQRTIDDVDSYDEKANKHLQLKTWK